MNDYSRYMLTCQTGGVSLSENDTSLIIHQSDMACLRGQYWDRFNCLYMLPRGHMIMRYGVSYHCYAHDIQALPTDSSLNNCHCNIQTGWQITFYSSHTNQRFSYWAFSIFTKLVARNRGVFLIIILTANLCNHVFVMSEMFFFFF